jgi:hypothetical protein
MKQIKTHTDLSLPFHTDNEKKKVRNGREEHRHTDRNQSHITLADKQIWNMKRRAQSEHRHAL